MCNYVFSPSENTFYAIALKKDYELGATWPVDGISVADEVFREFTEAPPNGKYRLAGNDGLPVWDNIPPLTDEELEKRAEQKKVSLITAATIAIAPLQDAVDLDMNTEEEKERLMEWKKYRVLLMRIDTSTAPDIEWPAAPVSAAPSQNDKLGHP